MKTENNLNGQSEYPLITIQEKKSIMGDPFLQCQQRQRKKFSIYFQENWNKFVSLICTESYKFIHVLDGGLKYKLKIKYIYDYSSGGTFWDRPKNGKQKIKEVSIG